MIEFRYDFEPEVAAWERTAYSVVVTTEAIALDELMEDFTSFLRAVGYTIDGYLDVVDDEITDCDDKGVTESTTDDAECGENCQAVTPEQVVEALRWADAAQDLLGDMIPAGNLAVAVRELAWMLAHGSQTHDRFDNGLDIARAVEEMDG